jgi:hypothetical protein
MQRQAEPEEVADMALFLYVVPLFYSARSISLSWYLGVLREQIISTGLWVSY